MLLYVNTHCVISLHHHVGTLSRGLLFRTMQLINVLIVSSDYVFYFAKVFSSVIINDMTGLGLLGYAVWEQLLEKTVVG